MRYYINSGLFSVLILCFFLPFIEIKCNDSTLAKMNGFDLAISGDISLEDSGMMDYLKESEEYKTYQTKKKEHADPFTISVLLLCLAGVVTNIVVKKMREKISISLGFLVAGILFVFKYVFTAAWDEKMPELGKMMSIIKLEFGTGFWLVISGSIGLIALNIYYLISDRRDKYISVYNPSDAEPDISQEV
jgi:ammonia channel protein AmtB